MSNPIKWDIPEFTRDWIYYLMDIKLLTPEDKRKLKGLVTMSPFVYGYAIDKAVEFPEQFNAYLTKRKIIGESYEPE
jgi:hypothetical protein